MDRFRDDPDCRVFLSTDAGGTGLNLQAADTVINLEVPWNPAVLEQRIARVHRMGQHRPVQVVNLVTRDTHRGAGAAGDRAEAALFAGVFAGDAGRGDFAALGQPTFLETVRRTWWTRSRPRRARRTNPRAELATAGVQILEALPAVLAAERQSSQDGDSAARRPSG